MKTEEIITIIIIISVIIFSLILVSNLNKKTTGETIIDRYIYTKAICNETNFCQDYEIICENEKLADLKPISGAVVQNSKDWQDPRPEENKNQNGLCNISK